MILVMIMSFAVLSCHTPGHLDTIGQLFGYIQLNVIYFLNLYHLWQCLRLESCVTEYTCIFAEIQKGVRVSPPEQINRGG